MKVLNAQRKSAQFSKRVTQSIRSGLPECRQAPEALNERFENENKHYLKITPRVATQHRQPAAGLSVLPDPLNSYSWSNYSAK